MILTAILLAAAAAPADPVEALERRVDEVLQRALPAYTFFPGGSGFIITENGYILTNHHVAGSQEETQVILTDGRRRTVRKVCTDPVGDVSLFKMPDEGPYPFVDLGDSDAMRAGEYSIAIGNPFGYGNERAEDGRYHPTVSVGIVSAVHRRQGTYFDCLQTDAAVNPGNSGGPLFNLRGEVIGINGRIATRFGARVNSGVGFAISANQIRRFLPGMMAGGTNQEIQHARIGGLVILRQASDGAGTRVQDVAPGSNAERSGFQAGDMIVRVDETPTPSWTRFSGAVGAFPAGAQTTVVVERAGGEVPLAVTLDPWREEAETAGQQRPPGAGYAGIIVEDAEGGVTVTHVEGNSPAARAGLEEGDVITRLNGVHVADTETFLRRLWQYRPGNRVTLRVIHGEEERDMQVELARHPND